MAASKTKSWLQRIPPASALHVNIINSICSMVKMTFTLRLQKEKEDEYWKKWGCFNLEISLHALWTVPAPIFLLIVQRCPRAHLFYVYSQMSGKPTCTASGPAGHSLDWSCYSETEPLCLCSPSLLLNCSQTSRYFSVKLHCGTKHQNQWYWTSFGH